MAEQASKKRSLSSYLSNVSSRKEELEKLAEKEQKEAVQNKDVVASVQNEQQVVNSFDGKAENSNSNEDEDDADERMSPSRRKHVVEQEISTPIHRRDLQSMLYEPSRKSNLSDRDSNEEEEDADDDDVDSDAPTDVASPPRPKLSRLVRHDQLQESQASSAFDNNSDSELSDIDDTRHIGLSSSVLHVQSSPSKAYNSKMNSSPGRVSISPHRQSKDKELHTTAKHAKRLHRDAGGRTKLQITCDKGKLDLVKQLLAEGIYDVNDQDNAGNSALHEAALNGHLEIVKLLVENGAQVNLQSYKMFQDTPLIDASSNGHLDVVKYLLEHGANPTLTNAKGFTAYDSIEDDSDFDEEEKRIVKEIKSCLRDATQKWSASDNENEDTVLRRKELSKPTLQDVKEERITNEDEFFWTDITSRTGKEKLFKASKEGNMVYVGLYLENGGRVDFKSFLESIKHGHEDIASLFLAFGAQVNASLKDGSTPLMQACGRGHIGTVNLLLEAGADADRHDKNGKTALDYATNSETGIVDPNEVELVKKSMNINVRIGKRKIEHQRTVKERDSMLRKKKEEMLKQKDQEILKNMEVHSSKRAESTEMDRKDKRKSIQEEEEQSVSKKIKNEHRNSTSKVHEETEEEREQRLKAEEEYLQKRLQHKKKKEKELLDKLVQDERKREEEKARQQIEANRKLEEERLAKEKELAKLKGKEEVQRRIQIRSLYPLGLKLVDFQKKSDLTEYLPLYWVSLEGTKYVLDLQLLVILKQEIATSTRIAVEPQHKLLLWNVLKFIFLYGGRRRSSSSSSSNKQCVVDFDQVPWDQRVEIDEMEYHKFAELPMHWVPWNSIEIPADGKEQLERHMVELNLPSSISKETRRSVISSPAYVPKTPAKFHKRPAVTRFLEANGSHRLWS